MLLSLNVRAEAGLDKNPLLQFLLCVCVFPRPLCSCVAVSTNHLSSALIHQSPLFRSLYLKFFVALSLPVSLSLPLSLSPPLSLSLSISKTHLNKLHYKHTCDTPCTQYLWVLKTCFCSFAPLIFLPVQNGFYPPKWCVDRSLFTAIVLQSQSWLSSFCCPLSFRAFTFFACSLHTSRCLYWKVHC